MTRFAIVSGRRYSNRLAECCTQDFEDALYDSTNGAMLCPAPGDNLKTQCDADFAIVVALNFDRMSKLLQATEFSSNCKVVGYVFGAYLAQSVRERRPIFRKRGRHWYGAFYKLSTLYLGFGDWVDEIASNLQVETTYLPMAANVLHVSAKPFDGANRPIAVSAFGRQHKPTLDALADDFNHPGSSDILHNPNFLNTNGAKDVRRYRDMFWQVLRQSKVSLAFDHMAAPGESGAHCSYVGPRWFESLAAGCIVAGFPPQSDDYDHLLYWPDATIALPDDPDRSVLEIRELISDPDRVVELSTRNLAEMNRAHDWRHRFDKILQEHGVPRPLQLAKRLVQLEGCSMQLSN